MLKFVYVLISSDSDYYAEQAALSMYSLLLHNPGSHIVLVSDEDTLKSLTDGRSLIKDYVSEYITVNPPVGFSPKERSRFLKTSIRQNVKGDFLFLDSDTIITGDLTDCHKSDCEIGAVLDCHKTADGNTQKFSYVKETKIALEDYNLYFNTGVLFVRDTDNAARFFAEWHRIWNDDRTKNSTSIDQPAFAQADTACNHLVREIDGRYNCQIVTPGAKKYFFDPLIIHYMSDLPYFSSFPLKNKKLLATVRENGISAEIENIVRNPQLAFLENSFILGGEELEIYQSPVMILGRKLARDYAWTNKVAKFIYRLFGFKI